MTTWLITALLFFANAPGEYNGTSVLNAFSRSAASEMLAYFPNANIVMLMRKGEPVPLQLETNLSTPKGCCAHRATPALSHQGERIAYVHVLSGQPRREAVAIYDVATGKSVDVFESEVVWSVAWSLDDSRLAAIADGDASLGRSVYLIVPESGRSAERVHLNLDINGVQYQVSNYTTPSWDLDGKRLALELRRRSLGAGNSAASVIGVLNLDTRAAKELAEGVEPSWSPAGDQVVYYPRNRRSCFTVNTNTGEKRLLFAVGKRGAGAGRGPLFYPVVWSPDGSQLLFHQWADPDLITNIYKLDIATGNSQKVGRTEIQVVNWRQAK